MGVIYRRAIYPIYHWLKRDGVNAAMRELRWNQWLSADELQSIQKRKLAALLDFAVKNVPYYSKLFRQLNMPLARLAAHKNFLLIPTLTKSDIRANRETLVSHDLTANSLIQNSTSGSTGEPLYFCTDTQSMLYRKASEIRGKTFTGWQLGDRNVFLWGSPIDEKLAGTVRGRLRSLISGGKFLSSFNLSSERMDQYAATIRRFRPVLISSYPSPLEEFARHCRDLNIRFPSLRGIITSAETLWPHQREVIEDAFGVKIFNRYGCREVADIAQECVVHDGLHVSVDRLYLEILDDDGQPCSPGESGRVVVTDLDNFGFPFIRYEIGDNAVWATTSPCPCGRSSPRLERIDGRTMDIVCAPNGNRIGGTFWTLLFRSWPSFRQFQVVQNRLDGILVNFVRSHGFDENNLKYFEAKIAEKCGSDFQVEFIEVNSIDVTGSGKARLVISNVERPR